jgi:hypothetical protein
MNQFSIIILTAEATLVLDNHDRLSAILHALALDNDPFTLGEAKIEECWSICLADAPVRVAGDPVEFSNCNTDSCVSTKPLRRYIAYRLSDSASALVKFHEMDRILRDSGFPTHSLPIVTEKDRTCSEMILVTRYNHRVSELAWGSYAGYNYRSVSRLAARSLYLISGLHQEFKIGYSGQNWLHALAARDWYDIGNAVIEHSGHLAPLCSSGSEPIACVSARDDVKNLVEALARLSPAANAFVELEFLIKELKLSEGSSKEINFEYWIDVFTHLSGDTELTINRSVVPPTRAVPEGSRPLNSFTNLSAETVLRICANVLRKLKQIHSLGLGHDGKDEKLLEHIYLAPSGEIEFDPNFLGSISPDMYTVKRRADLIEAAHAFWELAVKNSNIGISEYSSHPYDVGHVLSDFLTTSLLLGPSEVPAYNEWINWFTISSTDTYPIIHVEDERGLKLLYFQQNPYDVRPYVEIRYGEHEEVFLALFDTGSNPSFAQIDTIVTLSNEDRERCLKELSYGTEWCSITIAVDGLYKTIVHIGSIIQVETEIHVTGKDDSRYVNYLVGIGPLSEFSKKFPVFTFIPIRSHESEAGRIVMNEAICFTDRKVYIPLTGHGYGWTIPGAVAINPSTSNGNVVYTNTEFLLDTGANTFDIPQRAFIIFVENMARMGRSVTYTAPGFPVIQNCRNIEKFPAIHFALGYPTDGLTLTLLPSDYISSAINNEGNCNVLFRPITSSTVVLGFQILSRFTIEFNAGEKSVALCRP